MFGIGIQELAIICVVALLVFGPKRLPEVARSLGKGLSEFRQASSDLRQSFSLDADPPPPTPPADAADPRTSEEEPERPPQAVDAALPDSDPPAPSEPTKAMSGAESAGTEKTDPRDGA